MKLYKRVSALLMTAAIVCTLIPAAGAESRTVVIDSVEDFQSFADQCARDVWSQGVTVELTADLDFQTAAASPVPIFQGTFCGNGHTISGLSICRKGSRVGLFRTLTQSAVVKDLTVEGNVTPEGSACQVGILAGENYGLIQNCTVRGVVTGQEDAGGIVGRNGETGTVERCSSAASVCGVANVGGIAGQNLGTISYCDNSGEIATAEDEEIPISVGGITGLSRGTITQCTNTGAVGYQHLGYNVGGIAGVQSGEIRGCVNTGTIRGRKDVGGIVGQFEPDVHVTYGAAPMDSLNDAMGDFLLELETFTNAVNAMTDRGVDHAKVIQDALSAIEDRTDAAGTEGREDFQAMAEKLESSVDQMQDAVDALRGAAGDFQDEAEDGFRDLLGELEAFQDTLENAGSHADANLTQAFDALDRTLGEIHTQVQKIQTEIQAMAAELDALHSYMDTVKSLLKAGDVMGALSQPLPALDFSSHANAIGAALAEIPQLLRELNSRWKTAYDSFSGQLGQDWNQWNQSAQKMERNLQKLLDAGQNFNNRLGRHLDTVDQAVEAIETLLRDYTDIVGDKMQSVSQDLDAQFTVIENQLSQINDGLSEDNETLHRSCLRMIQNLEKAREAISQLGETPELTVQDLTEEVTQGPGLVGDCTASASVEGDSNVGGIVGTVAPEVGDDPEATVDLDTPELTTDVYATLRAVVRTCRFDGAVVVKNDCGGGIAGRCTAGAILDCAARGTVETGSDYCGGIVGRTQGEVIRCAALTDLTGESWLGGIAGLGNNLTDCRAMVRTQSDGEYLGAIAGQAEGDLSGNRYLLEEVYGVDGVDYAETAQGLPFADFSALDGIPADFLTFSIRFVVDGNTVAEVPFSYGGTLDESQVPQAPERDGQYGQWPDYPTENLTRSMVLEAQFEMPETTLSSGGNRPELLAEGTFSPQAALSAEKISLPESLENGWVPVKAWEYSVTASQSEYITLRLRTSGTDHPAAALYENGTWNQVNATVDGSYLVFEAPVSGKVVLLDEHTAPVWLWGLCGAAVLLVLLLWYRRRHIHITGQSGVSSKACVEPECPNAPTGGTSAEG